MYQDTTSQGMSNGFPFFFFFFYGGKNSVGVGVYMKKIEKVGRMVFLFFFFFFDMAEKML